MITNKNWSSWLVPSTFGLRPQVESSNPGGGLLPSILKEEQLGIHYFDNFSVSPLRAPAHCPKHPSSKTKTILFSWKRKGD